LYYDGLSESSLAELKQLANDQGMALLQSLNERALKLKQQDQLRNQQNTASAPSSQPLNSPRISSQRINIGLYVFDEPDHIDSKELHND
jgi:hypothetical protein